MKKLIFLSFFSVTLLAGCNQSEKENVTTIPGTESKVKKEVLAENKEEVSMKVNGMVCAMGCAKFIEDKVASLDGVVLSEVNFEEKEARFEYDKTSLSAKEIEDYINNIHDGQYEANIIEKTTTNDNASSDTEEGGEEKQSIVSVTQEVTNISFPQVFTYFLKRLR